MKEAQQETNNSVAEPKGTQTEQNSKKLYSLGLKQKLEPLYGYFQKRKTSFFNHGPKIYGFFQTPLGSTLAGAVIGGSIAYLIGYTKLSQERDEALEKLNKTEEYNDKLTSVNIELTNGVNELSRKNSDLSDQKISLTKKYLSCKQNFTQCKSNIDLIKSIHANSWFKPNISNIGNSKYMDSKGIKEESSFAHQNPTNSK